MSVKETPSIYGTIGSALEVEDGDACQNIDNIGVPFANACKISCIMSSMEKLVCIVFPPIIIPLGCSAIPSPPILLILLFL
jgi:hypothetical protein